MRSTMDDARQQVGTWATTGLTVLFGLQLVRVLFASFVGYLRDSQGVEALSLAPVALGVFAISFLAGGLRRAAGPRRAIWIAAGGVGLIRLVEQVSSSPPLDLVLSAAGVALFLLFIPNGLAGARSLEPDGATRFGYAFLLGVAADTAIQVWAGTMDLSWHPGIAPVVIVALLCATVFAALGAGRAKAQEGGQPGGTQVLTDAGWKPGLALIALGPWLFLQLVVYQNVARVSALTGWETPAAGALVVLGNALGLLAAAGVARLSSRTSLVAIACGLLLAGSLTQAEPSGLTAALLLFAGQILSLVMAMVLFVGLGRGVSRTGLARTTVAHGIGQILFVLAIFLYYVTYDIGLGFRAQIMLPLAALLVGIGAAVAGGRRSAQGEGPSEALRAPTAGRPVVLQPAIVALLLLVAPLGLALTWGKPRAVEPDPTNASIRVMDYNLHNGFNTDGRLDMEALARIIERSGADVIGLQEVSRGWLIWGGMDMLAWLSQRLDMPYVSGPTGDAQWGNAILSRYPIVSSETFPLPPDTLLLLRGYIMAEIDVGRGRVTLIDTHFTHRGSHDAIRERQAATLVSAWESMGATVIVGDMNATPDSEAMQALSKAGLVNVAAEICAPPVVTSPADRPRRQIDYIWVSPDLGFSDCEISQTTASDHLPVVATITLP